MPVWGKLYHAHTPHGKSKGPPEMMVCPFPHLYKSICIGYNRIRACFMEVGQQVTIPYPPRYHFFM